MFKKLKYQNWISQDIVEVIRTSEKLEVPSVELEQDAIVATQRTSQRNKRNATQLQLIL